MSKQVLDPKDKAGFMNLSSDGKHTQIVEAYAKSGKELEQYLEQSGAEFPIAIESHDVGYNEKEGYYFYKDANGNIKKISKEKGEAYKAKQERQGTIRKVQETSLDREEK